MESVNKLSKNFKKLFLNNFHIEQGAKLVPFSGYFMPINYNHGIIKEHIHTRKLVSVFDVSHMGQILIPNNIDNCKKLEKFIPINLENLKNNKCIYSFILNEEGGIIDDIIISKTNYKNNDYFFIIYNCSRKEINEKIFFSISNKSIILQDNSFLAIQGPLSSESISPFIEDIKKIKFMETCKFIYHNYEILISRTGYTGEDGFELSIPNKIVEVFINELILNKKVILCGLGCRDSLRLEAGLSLYGHELHEKITPVQANLSWAISKQRLSHGGFNGYDRIMKQMNLDNHDKRIGVRVQSKSILRSNMDLLDKNNKIVGKITSGGFSPTLNYSIGIAYLNNEIYQNFDKIYCLIRNNIEEIFITKLPFVKHNYAKGLI